MEQDMIRPSMNGFDFLESYLTELFGERGSFRHNLERYHRSPEFSKHAASLALFLCLW